MKRLQILIGSNNWKWVFCYNQHNTICTTENKNLALKERDLTYFQNRFGNNQFRIF